MTAERRSTRAEQRRDTEARILTAARALFAETGYDRTTIRAIAAEAGTDPGLVMRYFGSKAKLFTRIAEIPLDEPATGDPDQLAEVLLASLHDKLATEPSGTLAMLRSALTHPEVGEEVRAALTAQQHRAAGAMGAEDAVLRAGVIGAITLGTVIARYLLQLDALRDASPDEIAALLRPCFQTLTQAPTPP